MLPTLIEDSKAFIRQLQKLSLFNLLVSAFLHYIQFLILSRQLTKIYKQKQNKKNE